MQPQTYHSVRERTKLVAAETVSVPQDHEGVGRALRSAYLPRVSDMPSDLQDLLDKLN